MRLNRGEWALDTRERRVPFARARAHEHAPVPPRAFTPYHLPSGLRVISATEGAGSDARTLVLEPGLTLGPARRRAVGLCLYALDIFLGIGKRASMLDLDASAGILCLVASRRGVPRVVAIEPNPYCRLLARWNIRRNHARVTLHSAWPAGMAQGLDPERFDVVAATAWPRARQPAIMAALAPGGLLIVSGFGPEREDEVLSSLPGELCLLTLLRERDCSVAVLCRA